MCLSVSFKLIFIDFSLLFDKLLLGYIGSFNFLNCQFVQFNLSLWAKETLLRAFVTVVSNYTRKWKPYTHKYFFFARHSKLIINALARMETAKKSSILITREKSSKVGFKEAEMNKVLFCSKLYKFVWVLFIFK